MAGISKDHRDIEAQMERQRNGEGVKHDTGKPRLDLLSEIALEKTARAYEHGARKYAEGNWRKGMLWSRLIGASLRHILAYNRGEDTDPESGLSHLAHAAASISFLLEYEETHRDKDDRYKA